MGWHSRLAMVQQETGGLMRTATIWVAGLLASGIFGGLIGDKFLSRPWFEAGGGLEGGIWGFLGGVLAFTCLRLWLATPHKNSK